MLFCEQQIQLPLGYTVLLQYCGLSEVNGAQDLIYFNEGGDGVAILENKNKYQFPHS